MEDNLTFVVQDIQDAEALLTKLEVGKCEISDLLQEL